MTINKQRELFCKVMNSIDNKYMRILVAILVSYIILLPLYTLYDVYKLVRNVLQGLIQHLSVLVTTLYGGIKIFPIVVDIALNWNKYKDTFIRKGYVCDDTTNKK